MSLWLIFPSPVSSGAALVRPRASAARVPVPWSAGGSASASWCLGILPPRPERLPAWRATGDTFGLLASIALVYGAQTPLLAGVGDSFLLGCSAPGRVVFSGLFPHLAEWCVMRQLWLWSLNYWAACLITGLRQAHCASTSTTVIGFVAGSVVSSMATIFHHWVWGPKCSHLSREQFDSLKPCNDCNNKQDTTTTTTAMPLLWDFWWWFQCALCLDFFTAIGMVLLCIWACCGFLGSNRVLGTFYHHGISEQQRLLPAPVAQPLQNLVGKQQLAQAQLATLRQRLQSPVQG